MNTTRVNNIIRKINRLYRNNNMLSKVEHWHEDYDGYSNTFCLEFFTGETRNLKDDYGYEDDFYYLETFDTVVNIDVDVKLRDINYDFIQTLIEESAVREIWEERM